MPQRTCTRSPKHRDAGSPGSQQGLRETRNDLLKEQSAPLAKHPKNCVLVYGKRQLVGVKDNTIYVFKHDNFAGYHAYSVGGKELCTRLPTARAWVAERLGTSVKRCPPSGDSPFQAWAREARASSESFSEGGAWERSGVRGWRHSGAPPGGSTSPARAGL